MKSSSALSLALAWGLSSATVQAATLSHATVEDWKGKPTTTEGSLGGMAGLGVVDGSAGFSLLGTAAKKIVEGGFVKDINNSVWIEVEIGPMWVATTTVATYSLHLRWDFQKDRTWTIYALGGLAGVIPAKSLGNSWELFPRFGVGGLLNLNDDGNLALRLELSHEFIGAGLVFAL